MKIINNYDLMDKISTANNGFQLQKAMLKEFKFQAGMLGFFTGWDLALSSDREIQWLTNLMICSSFFAAKVTAAAIFEKRFKNDIELKAYLELAKLALQLTDLNLSTTPDLLKEAELTQTDYNIRLSENHIPIIKQNKYILIPTYDNLGDIKDTSLLQEHDIGSKKYILSIGSPKKVLKLAPSYSM